MHSGLIQQLSSLGLPQEGVIKVVFYLICALTVFFCVRIVISRNIFHSAIYLAMALIGVACVYLYLDAQFMAIAQIIIYVGAVVTLFLFAIMLTANIQDRAIRQSNRQVFISALCAVGFLFIIVKVIKENFWNWGSAPEGSLGIEQLGRALMGAYVLPFEIISLILIAVLVGAIVIGKAHKQ